MTIIDFLNQAGFWQWIGIIMLASIAGGTICGTIYGLGHLRIFGNITKTENHYYDKDKVKND